MIESYLYARDHFLKPGGTMVPSTGTIFIAPFTDGHLWTQTMAKARFWEQQNFYGVDLSPLYAEAREEVFGQPIVGGFDEKQLLSPSISHLIDFEKTTMEALKEFVIPFAFVASYTGLMHGIASWFDIDLAGYTLSTAPHLERTHWHQVRLLIKGVFFSIIRYATRRSYNYCTEPLAVNAGQTVRGWLHFVVNSMRSYNITLELVMGPADAPLPLPPITSSPSSIPSPASYHGDGHVRRSGFYSLHEQSYHFDTYPVADSTKPEMLGLYPPESALAESSPSSSLPDQ
jgi:histone-arginine methyltransferase CARM1